MKAISIQQPWAWLIMRPDVENQAERDRLARLDQLKMVENRTWFTSHRGPLAIHVSKAYTKRRHAEYRDVIQAKHNILLPEYESMEVGGLIGTVNLIDCVRSSPSQWFLGPWGFILTNAKPCTFVAMTGRLSMFEIDPSLIVRGEIEKGMVT